MGFECQEINMYMRITKLKSLPKYNVRQRKSLDNKIWRIKLIEATTSSHQMVSKLGYSPINGKLRGIKPEWKVPSESDMRKHLGFVMSIDEAVMHLDAIAENTPRRRRNLTVFRGEANKARLKELVGMEIGESYVDAGFLEYITWSIICIL